MLRGGAKEPAAQHPSFLGLPHPVLRGDHKGLYLPYPLCFLSPCLPYENTGDTQTPAFKSHHREFSLTVAIALLCRSVKPGIWERWEAWPPALAVPLPHSATLSYLDGLGLLIHRIKPVSAKLGIRPIWEGILLPSACRQMTLPTPLEPTAALDLAPSLILLCHSLQHQW